MPILAVQSRFSHSNSLGLIFTCKVSKAPSPPRSVENIMRDCSGALVNVLQAACSGVTRMSQWISLQQGGFLYAALAAVITIWLLALVITRSKWLPFLRSITSDPEQLSSPAADGKSQSQLKQVQRPDGVWIPVSFKRPAAPPYPAWDVHSTKPLPYRPFRHGPYYITMGLRTMKWDEWIELDNQFPRFHADKVKRIKERGAKCSKTAPEALDGACELLEEL